jgi:hypothetical protein
MKKHRKILPRTALDLQQLCARPELQSSESFLEENGKLTIHLYRGNGQLSDEKYNLGTFRRAGWNAIWICGQYAAVEVRNTGWGFCKSTKEARKLFAEG